MRTAAVLVLCAMMLGCGDVKPDGWHFGGISGFVDQKLEGEAFWCARDLDRGDTLFHIELTPLNSDEVLWVASDLRPTQGARWTLEDTLPRGNADGLLALPVVVRDGRQYHVSHRAGNLAIGRVTPDSIYGELNLDVVFWDMGPVPSHEARSSAPDTAPTVPVVATTEAEPVRPAGTGGLRVWFAAARWKKCD